MPLFQMRLRWKSSRSRGAQSERSSVMRILRTTADNYEGGPDDEEEEDGSGASAGTTLALTRTRCIKKMQRIRSKR
jgi:hypothetical protein